MADYQRFDSNIFDDIYRLHPRCTQYSRTAGCFLCRRHGKGHNQEPIDLRFLTFSANAYATKAY